MMLIACKSSFDIVNSVSTFLVEFVVTPDGVYGREVPPFPSKGPLIVQPRMVCTSFLNSQQRVSQWLPLHRWHLDVVFPESTSLDEGFLQSLTPFLCAFRLRFFGLQVAVDVSENWIQYPGLNFDKPCNAFEGDLSLFAASFVNSNVSPSLLEWIGKPFYQLLKTFCILNLDETANLFLVKLI